MGNVLAFAAARMAGKPVLVTQHVGLVPYRNPALAATMQTANRLLAARLLKGSAATVFYSRTTQNYFSRWLGNDFPAAWISNGVDTCFHPVEASERQQLRRQLGWPQDRQVMLFAGRFVEKKGIDIIRHLAERFPDRMWVMAGSGPHNPNSWRLPNVQIMGQCAHQNMARVFQAADLLVLPSVGEGFPLVVQESMACGTPVAVSSETAAAHPGVAELVWSTTPEPQPFEALIQSIVSAPALLHDRRAAVAAFARREWNWDVCADRYARLLRGLTSPSRQRSQSTKIPPTTAL
jgi:glycosyltransferase involved in cell wall biosynthesis